jgi:hypothetical protein
VTPSVRPRTTRRNSDESFPIRSSWRWGGTSITGPEGRLLGLTNASGIYGRLLEPYRQADERYNSGLFHFRQEKARAEEFDRLTPGLTIEDKVEDKPEVKKAGGVFYTPT